MSGVTRRVAGSAERGAQRAYKGGGRCWAWYMFMTSWMWVGIIHGRHLSLCSLGWRAGRSGGSRLAEASTISHSKDCIWTECVHSERATGIGLTIFNFIHIEVWARGPRWLHDDSRWWRPSKEKNGRKRGWRICTVRAPLNNFPDWKGLGMLDDAVGRTRGVTYLSYEFFYIYVVSSYVSVKSSRARPVESRSEGVSIINRASQEAGSRKQET